MRNRNYVAVIQRALISATLFFAIIAISGCGTATSFRAEPGVSPLTGRDADRDRPFSVFDEGENIPAPFEKVGTIKIRDTGFTMIGGSKSAVRDEAIKLARERSADGIAFRKFYAPDIWSTIWRVDADVLRLNSETLNWPSRSVARGEFLSELAKSEDPDQLGLTGIWETTDRSFEVAISRPPASDRSEYDYVGHILSSDAAGWNTGYLKFGMRQSASESVLLVDFFDENFEKNGATIVIEVPGLIKIPVRETGGSGTTLLVKTAPTADTTRTPSVASGSTRSGSGFRLSGTNLFVTNWHVVDGATKVSLSGPGLDGNLDASVVASDPGVDLALLEVGGESPSREAGLLLGSTAGVGLGDSVYTLGFPLHGILGSDVTYVSGAVSSTRGANDDARLLQVSIPLQPGNSGGPLVAEDGVVVGVIVSTLNARSVFRLTGSFPQNVGFAIKAEYVLNLLTVAGIPTDDLIGIETAGPTSVAAARNAVVRVTARP